MSPYAYPENQLVEQLAIDLFAALSWQTVLAMEEAFGAGGTLGRETKGEVVLAEQLGVARSKLNHGLLSETIETAIEELARDRSAMSLEAVNRELYKLLKYGIRISVPDSWSGQIQTQNQTRQVTN